jgi:LytS/YehU family sensor histidine kinase
VLGVIGLGYGGIQASYAAIQLEKEVERLKKLEAQSREKNLIQHLQPHFLFNALNTIYALARKNQPETPQTILELADLLRYSLDASKKERVSISEEIHFLNAYCDFQQKRLPKTTQVVKSVEISDETLLIYPLLFQPVVENAFKYVDTSREGEISIVWKQSNQEIYFSCSNPIAESNEANQSAKLDSSGTGLVVFEDRLKALYGEQARFTIKKTPTLFNLTCIISL